MRWSYHFLDLTDDDKHLRRQLLDYYGALAQVSVFIPLLFLQCSFALDYLYRRLRSKDGLETPSSPHSKSQRSRRTASTRSIAVTVRKLAWWSGDSCNVFSIQLGTNGEVISVLIWTAWLLFLCFARTGQDYLHLTKRFGIIASSQLPFHYLLALKSPYSPLQILTRTSHETLNSLHQLLGRIITLLLYLHAALYINFYVLSNLLPAKLKEAYVLCGIFGIIAFTVVGTTALAPVRKWSYRVFYVVHVTLATALLPVLFFHVSHIRIYLYETALVYALNAGLRMLGSQTLSGTIKAIPQSNLIEVDLPLARGRSTSRPWQAGRHAYVSLAGHPFLRTFKSNPFTVASIPEVDGKLRFVAKVLDGNTAKLASSADASNKMQKLTIEGPYGLASHGERLLRYDRVLLVAGGVGATFILPLYRQLLADLSPSKGSYRRQKVSFLWTVRSKVEMLWALPDNEQEREAFAERLSVCITGAGEDLGSTANGSFALDAEDDCDRFGEGGEAIELQEQQDLLSDKPIADVRTAPDSILTFAGRPNLSKLVDQTFSHGSGSEKVAIVVCGPRSLSHALRKQVGRWVWRGRQVWFWEESFAF